MSCRVEDEEECVYFQESGWIHIRVFYYMSHSSHEETCEAISRKEKEFTYDVH